MSSTTGRSTSGVSLWRAAIQRTTLIVGVVFLVVGILGFIPGRTTNAGDMTFARG